MFSGFDPENASTTPSSWKYEGAEVNSADGTRPAARRVHLGGPARQRRSRRRTASRYGSGGPRSTANRTLRDAAAPALRLPGAQAALRPLHAGDGGGVCGISPELFHQVAEAWVTELRRDRTTAFAYAVGWTQHTVGAQYIRTAGDPAGAARQHWPPRRRDHGAARARLDPGLHRHPDAVQPAARLHPDAARAEHDSLDDSSPPTPG